MHTVELSDLNHRNRLKRKMYATPYRMHVINPLPTKYCHDLQAYKRVDVLILGVILQYMVSASLGCFLWLVKG